MKGLIPWISLIIQLRFNFLRKVLKFLDAGCMKALADTKAIQKSHIFE